MNKNKFDINTNALIDTVDKAVDKINKKNDGITLTFGVTNKIDEKTKKTKKGIMINNPNIYNLNIGDENYSNSSIGDENYSNLNQLYFYTSDYGFHYYCKIVNKEDMNDLLSMEPKITNKVRFIPCKSVTNLKKIIKSSLSSSKKDKKKKKEDIDDRATRIQNIVNNSNLYLQIVQEGVIKKIETLKGNIDNILVGIKTDDSEKTRFSTNTLAKIIIFDSLKFRDIKPDNMIKFPKNDNLYYNNTDNFNELKEKKYFDLDETIIFDPNLVGKDSYADLLIALDNGKEISDVYGYKNVKIKTLNALKNYTEENYPIIKTIIKEKLIELIDYCIYNKDIDVDYRRNILNRIKYMLENKEDSKFKLIRDMDFDNIKKDYKDVFDNIHENRTISYEVLDTYYFMEGVKVNGIWESYCLFSPEKDFKEFKKNKNNTSLVSYKDKENNLYIGNVDYRGDKIGLGITYYSDGSITFENDNIIYEYNKKTDILKLKNKTKDLKNKIIYQEKLCNSSKEKFIEFCTNLKRNIKIGELYQKIPTFDELNIEFSKINLISKMYHFFNKIKKDYNLNYIKQLLYLISKNNNKKNNQKINLNDYDINVKFSYDGERDTYTPKVSLKNKNTNDVITYDIDICFNNDEDKMFIGSLKSNQVIEFSNNLISLQDGEETVYKWNKSLFRRGSYDKFFEYINNLYNGQSNNSYEKANDFINKIKKTIEGMNESIENIENDIIKINNEINFKILSEIDERKINELIHKKFALQKKLSKLSNLVESKNNISLNVNNNLSKENFKEDEKIINTKDEIKNNINNTINTKNKYIIDIENSDNNNSSFKEDSKEKEINDDMYTEINNTDIASKKINLSFDNVINVKKIENSIIDNFVYKITNNLVKIDKLKSKNIEKNLKITEDYYNKVDKIRKEIYDRNPKLYSKLENEEVSIILYSQIKKIMEKIKKNTNISHTYIEKENKFLKEQLVKIHKLHIDSIKEMIMNCKICKENINNIFNVNENLIKNDDLINRSKILNQAFSTRIKYENEDIDFIKKGEKYEKKSKNKETINFGEMESNIDKNNFYRNQLNKEFNELIEENERKINKINKLNYMIR